MEFITYARPYAKAAFSYAKSHGNLERWEKMLWLMGELIRNNKVQSMLLSPILTSSQRATHLVHLMGDEIDSGGKNLLNVLSENKRLLLLPWIAQHFSVLKATYEQEQEVIVTSAYELKEQELKTLTTKMTQRLGKRIKITTVIDQSLLGGVKICAGNWVYDDTLKARLDKLASAITS